MSNQCLHPSLLRTFGNILDALILILKITKIIQAKESPISDKQKWKTGPEISGGWRKISYSLNNSLFLTAHHSSENLTIEEEGKIFHVQCN